MRGSRGQLIVGVLIAFAVMMVFVPAVLWWAREDTKATVRQKKSTVAYYLAEGGVDRGLWKLQSSAATLESVLAGGSLAGYSNDQVYTDMSGGSYRIWLGSGPGLGEVTIVGTGKDQSSAEYRAVEAVFRQGGVQAAIIAPAVLIAGSAKVFWGPVMSTGNMGLQGSANELFPRKYARGSITVTGGGYADRDDDPTPPNTDSLEWWAYNESPGVPDPPAVDLDYYKTLAQSQGLYFGSSPANRTVSNLVDTDDAKVRYYESNVKFTGSKHFRGVLIVMGDLEMQGSGDSGSGCYSTATPADAWQEYRKNTPSGGSGCAGGGGWGAADDGDYDDGSDAEGDQACSEQYPGDAGLNEVHDFHFCSGCVAHGDAGGASTEPVSFKGFIYVRGSLGLSGSARVHGAVQVDQGGSVSSGSFDIFFDPDLDVQLTTAGLTRRSWKEAPAAAF